MLLYYITDRTQFTGTERERRARVLARIAECARCEIDFIQLREKDLCARDLESLGQAAVEAVRASGSATRLLINSRVDVALAVGADGVHLRSNDMSAVDARKIWRGAGINSDPVIAVSCHTGQEVIAAKSDGVQFVVFGPVFEKRDVVMATTAIERLRSACRTAIPVLALGGVTAENAESCVRAGVAGVAGIRLFQEGNLQETVRKLRSL